MVSILFYLVILVLLIAEYRKLRGTDEKSLEYQSRLEERVKHSSLIPSTKVFAQALAISMIVTSLLLLIALFGFLRSVS
jgi:hypothetical protein